MATIDHTMAVLALPSGLWLALCRHVLDLSRPNMVHVSLKVHRFPFGLSNISISSSHSSSFLRHVVGWDVVMHLAFRGRGLCRGALHGICDWQAPNTTRACNTVHPSPCRAWPGRGTAILPSHIVVLIVANTASRPSTLNSRSSGARVEVVRISLPDDALLLFQETIRAALHIDGYTVQNNVVCLVLGSWSQLELGTHTLDIHTLESHITSRVRVPGSRPGIARVLLGPACVRDRPVPRCRVKCSGDSAWVRVHNISLGRFKAGGLTSDTGVD